MPLDSGLYGSARDGKESALYCKYCFGERKVTQDITLEEMADRCAVHLVQAHPEFSSTRAKEYMLGVLPLLSLWKK